LRICVDLRRRFDCGVGRVAYNVAIILNNLKVNFDFKLILLVSKDTITDAKTHFSGVDIIYTDANFFSHKDMFELPKLIEKEIDAFWASQFYISPFYNCPVVTTIHDLWPVKYSQWLPNHDEVRKRHGEDVIEVAQKIIHYFEANLLIQFNRVQTLYNTTTDILNRFMFACMHLAARQAKIIATPSLYSLEEISTYFPEYSHKLKLLYPFVSNTSLPRKLNNDKVDRILMVAKFDPRKNHKFILSSLPTLFHLYSEQNKTVEIYFVGEIGYRSFGKELVQLGNLLQQAPHKIFFTDSVSEKELWHYYLSCDLLIIPSLDEGFGLPLLEGLEAGIPCLAGNKGALPEVGDKFIYYSELTNPNDFAHEMFTILANKKEAIGKTNAGKKYVENKFSLENATIQVANIIKSLL